MIRLAAEEEFAILETNTNTNSAQPCAQDDAPEWIEIRPGKVSDKLEKIE
jgi:hypothetical protein